MALWDNDIIIFRNGVKGIYFSGRLLTDNPEDVIINFRFPDKNDKITEWDVVKVARIYKHHQISNFKNISKTIDDVLKNRDIYDFVYEEDKTFFLVYFYLTNFPSIKITNKLWVGDKIDCENYNNFNYYEKYTEILRVVKSIKILLEFHFLKQEYNIELNDPKRDSGKKYFNFSGIGINTDSEVPTLCDPTKVDVVSDFIVGNYFDSGGQIRDFAQKNKDFVNKISGIEEKDV